MIVIGVDVHKASLTAVAVDEVGREVGEQTSVDGAGLLVWSGSLAGERREKSQPPPTRVCDLDQTPPPTQSDIEFGNVIRRMS
jgi:hypothetical protein